MMNVQRTPQSGAHQETTAAGKPVTHRYCLECDEYGGGGLCRNTLTASPRRIWNLTDSLPVAPNVACELSTELAPILATAAVVKGKVQGPRALGHHVDGVVPAGDRAFDHHRRPAQGRFEPLPASFPDGTGINPARLPA